MNGRAQAPSRAAPSPAPLGRHDLVGIDQRVPVISGHAVPYINLDNAASTPALRSVVRALDEFLPFYSGVHRGTGYKSRLSTQAFERARDIVGGFFGADLERDVVLFAKNTTEAVNNLARSMSLPPEPVVLTTVLEHHSNDLPWRGRARTEHVGATPNGSLDLDHLAALLARHAGSVALLVVSGASNVTGVVQPVHQLAEMVHAVGGRILVDAAQLAPHRTIDMRPHHDAAHLDFVVCSAHKMYAPYGTGALVGPRAAFGAVPGQVGGGTVHAVTTDSVTWADLPDREEAGSPNVLGSIALATAIQAISTIGMDRLAVHELDVTRYATARLRAVPGVRVWGPSLDEDGIDKVGVIPFTVDGLAHALVAAALGYEHGIGVRSGCFCAQPYVAHLLGLDPSESATWVQRVREGDKRGAPGMVRISLGGYNTRSDVDRAIEALHRIVGGERGCDYRADLDGSFHPVDYIEPMLFSLA